jgi:hypothetical protein
VTTKTDFTPEAWQAILAAPGAIGSDAEAAVLVEIKTALGL